MSRDYKPTAKREKPSSKGNPFLVGLLIGLLIGVGISVAVAVFIKGEDSPFVHKNLPANIVKEETDTSAVPKTEKPENSEKTRFDFYTILPGSESQVTEQEIRQKQALPEVAKVKENYFLQVGAFQTEREADNMKAKLALLGMEAIVQTANIPDKGVWHRVRVGPFVDLGQIDKARGELTHNGFTADLIKIHSNTPDQ
ncbi:MAG TPA: SPOR domain-containing protein [Methylophilaceae bacterium]|nr:SPOR domain-containing protein [Methylophilaceae bacterium]